MGKKLLSVSEFVNLPRPSKYRNDAARFVVENFLHRRPYTVGIASRCNTTYGVIQFFFFFSKYSHETAWLYGRGFTLLPVLSARGILTRIRRARQNTACTTADFRTRELTNSLRRVLPRTCRIKMCARNIIILCTLTCKTRRLRT